jgi:hypothetical protein
VILISSIAGYNPEQGLTMYGVTKTALFGLTKVYAYLFFFCPFFFWGGGGGCHFSLFAVSDVLVQCTNEMRPAGEVLCVYVFVCMLCACTGSLGRRQGDRRWSLIRLN